MPEAREAHLCAYPGCKFPIPPGKNRCFLHLTRGEQEVEWAKRPEVSHLLPQQVAWSDAAKAVGKPALPKEVRTAIAFLYRATNEDGSFKYTLKQIAERAGVATTTVRRVAREARCPPRSKHLKALARKRREAAKEAKLRDERYIDWTRRRAERAEA